MSEKRTVISRSSPPSRASWPLAISSRTSSAGTYFVEGPQPAAHGLARSHHALHLGDAARLPRAWVGLGVEARHDLEVVCDVREGLASGSVARTGSPAGGSARRSGPPRSPSTRCCGGSIPRMSDSGHDDEDRPVETRALGEAAWPPAGTSRRPPRTRRCDLRRGRAGDGEGRPQPGVAVTSRRDAMILLSRPLRRRSSLGPSADAARPTGDGR